MTPEKAYFQENLRLNQNTPEQLEKLKNDLKAKVDTLKADGSFSGEDLADLVDLLDDKTILSPTEAKLKLHLESLQNLETQIDFLMALVEIGGENEKGGIKSEISKEKVDSGEEKIGEESEKGDETIELMILNTNTDRLEKLIEIDNGSGMLLENPEYKEIINISNIDVLYQLANRYNKSDLHERLIKIELYIKEIEFYNDPKNHNKNRRIIMEELHDIEEQRINKFVEETTTDGNETTTDGNETSTDGNETTNDLNVKKNKEYIEIKKKINELTKKEKKNYIKESLDKNKNIYFEENKDIIGLNETYEKQDETTVTPNLINFLISPSNNTYNILTPKEKVDSITEFLNLLLVDMVEIEDKDLFIKIINDFSKGFVNVKDPLDNEDKKDLILFLKDKLDGAGIYDIVADNLLGDKKAEFENGNEFRSIEILKSLEKNRVNIDVLKEEDFNDNINKHLIMNYFSINEESSFIISNMDRELLLTIKDHFLENIRSNHNEKFKNNFFEGVSKNGSLTIEDKKNIEGYNEYLIENSIEVKNIDMIKNLFHKNSSRDSYKKIFDFNTPEKLIAAINIIFSKEGYFKENLFIEYINPDSLELDSLIEISKLIKKPLPFKLINKISYDTLENLCTVVENDANQEKNQSDFIYILGGKENIIKNKDLYEIFEGFNDFKSKYLGNYTEIELKPGEEFSDSNFNDYLNENNSTNNESTLLNLKEKFGSNINIKNFLENKELQNFIINNLKKDLNSINEYDFLRKDLRAARIIVNEIPEAVEYFSNNIKSKPDFVLDFIEITIKNNKIDLIKEFNDINILEIVMDKNYNSRFSNLLKNDALIKNDIFKRKLLSFKTTLEFSEGFFNGVTDDIKNTLDIILNIISEINYENIDKIKEKKFDEKTIKEEFLFNEKKGILMLGNTEKEIRNKVFDNISTKDFKESLPDIKQFFLEPNSINLLKIEKKLNVEKTKKIIDIFINYKNKELNQRNQEINNKIIDIERSKKDGKTNQKLEKYKINGELNIGQIESDFKTFFLDPNNFKKNQKSFYDYVDNKVITFDTSIENFISEKLGIEKSDELYKLLETKLGIIQEGIILNDKKFQSGLYEHLKNNGDYDSFIQQKVFEYNLAGLDEKTRQDILNKLNSQESQNNSTNNFENISSGEYTLDTSNSVLKTESGKNISLNQEEVNMIQKNPDTMKNIINLYESLERVGLTKLWNYKEDIFKSLENVFRVQFDRKDGNYLDERETKILLNAVLTSLGEKPIKTDKKIDNFLSEVENINGRQVTGAEKEVNKLGESRLEASFIEKFVGRGDMIGFKQSAFEDSLKKIN